jgi:hypothetical protein
MADRFCIRHFRAFAGLPAGYAELQAEEIRRHGLFRCAEWFDYLMRNHFDVGDELCIYGVEEAGSGRPVLLAPLRRSSRDSAVPQCRVVASISHPENYTTVAFAFDPGLKDRAGALAALFGHVRAGAPAASAPPCDAIRLWPVELGSELGETIRRALRAAGFWVQPYANSYNRFEDTNGISYDAYFAQRSANLRYSVRRRRRALEKTGSLQIDVHEGGADLEKAIADYVSVSLHSWKRPGSMVSPPNLQLIRLAAAKGCLRLGILKVGGAAAAAQFWIVSGGTAHCARLAYHGGYKKLAVGVVLTNHMIAHVLDRDRVGKIDFGFGQEDYKGGWMREARDYYGFMAFNPATPRGLYQGARHILGHEAKRLAKRGLEALGLRKPRVTPGEAEQPE